MEFDFVIVEIGKFVLLDVVVFFFWLFMVWVGVDCFLWVLLFWCFFCVLLFFDDWVFFGVLEFIFYENLWCLFCGFILVLSIVLFLRIEVIRWFVCCCNDEVLLVMIGNVLFKVEGCIFFIVNFFFMVIINVVGVFIVCFLFNIFIDFCCIVFNVGFIFVVLYM